MPVIEIGQKAVCANADLVVSNNDSGMRELVALLDQEDVLVCLDGGGTVSAQHRREALRRALGARGASLRVVPAGPTIDSLPEISPPIISSFEYEHAIAPPSSSALLLQILPPVILEVLALELILYIAPPLPVAFSYSPFEVFTAIAVLFFISPLFISILPSSFVIAPP